MTQEDIDYKILELMRTRTLWHPLKYFISIPEDKINDCWNWTGSKTKSGHSFYSRRNIKYIPHIEIYKLFNGEYAPSYDIHHTCENKICVNPTHLIALSHNEHSKISSEQAVKAKKAGSTILGDFIVE